MGGGMGTLCNSIPEEMHLFRTSVRKLGNFSFFLEFSEILLKKVLIFFEQGFILSVSGAKW